MLTGEQADIVDATIATWPDGAVLDSFVVRATNRPGARDLAAAFEARLRRPLEAHPMPDLTLAFDNDALPWHTAVVVNGPDRAGVLSAVSSAFAASHVIVHSARIATEHGEVNDRFGVTDRFGRKLDSGGMERVRAALTGGSSRRRFRKRSGR